MSFTPPAYPYERLDGVREIAAQFEGGPIDCSVGTPVDPPPDFVIAELARAVGARGYPASAGITRVSRQPRRAGWTDDSTSTVAPEDVAACVGTKEFVASLAGYLHLRSPERDTVLYPAISYPTYAMGAALAACAPCRSPSSRDGWTSRRSNRATPSARWCCGRTRRRIRRVNSTTSAPSRRGARAAACSSRATSATRSSPGPTDPRTILEHGTERRPRGALDLQALEPRRPSRRLLRRRRGDGRVPAQRSPARGAHGARTRPGGGRARLSTTTSTWRFSARATELASSSWRRRSRALGVTAPMPEGAFYLWCSKRGDERLGARDGARATRRDSSSVPGEFYGEDASDFVRLAVVQPDERLALAAATARGELRPDSTMD